MFTLSARSLKALQGVHPDLVEVVKQTILATPVDFVVIEGLRTLKRQQELVAAGASQTMNSRHITGHAVDLAAWVGEIRWDMGLYYQIAATVQKVSRYTGIPVRWGGCWVRLDTATKTPAQLVADYVSSRKLAGKRAFIDSPHFELPAGELPMTAKKAPLIYHPWMTSAGGRKFLLVCYLTVSDQVLIWFGKISGEAYASIILGVVAVFVAGNAYIKTKVGNES